MTRPPRGVTVRLTEPVSRALHEGRPVVALESSVFAQGLPIPQNREAAERMVGAVERGGAVPAITAVVGGIPAAGLEPDELERFLARDGVVKVSARDLPAAVTGGLDGATTVAATLAIARHAGIPVFATGGIGGVHREPAYDESADLVELARTEMVVVCAGAKSILDLPATWERLETLGVIVLGYRTDELPGFFTSGTGIRLSHRADSPRQVADSFRAARALGLGRAVLVVQPPPPEAALAAAEMDRALAAALASARHRGVTGAAVTPFLLGEVQRSTSGRSLGANLALLEANAGLAAEIAVAIAETERTRDSEATALEVHSDRR